MSNNKRKLKKNLKKLSKDQMDLAMKFEQINKLKEERIWTVEKVYHADKYEKA